MELQLKNYNLETAYNDLINGSIDCFVFNKTKGVNEWDEEVDVLHLTPGSFNPLHLGHRNLMKSSNDNIFYSRKTLRAYELSIRRRGKEALSLEELQIRLKQFNDDEYVVITNADFFSRKTGCFPEHTQIHYHIGYDTAVRIISDDEVHGVQGIRATFWVYDRENNSYDDIERKPRNMRKGNLICEDYKFISSTQIRNS